MVAIEYGNLFDQYIVDYETTTVEGSSIYLKEGDEILLYDLLCGLMLRSGNDAATLIGKNVFKSTGDFVFHMNYLARIIEMKNSTFENPTGLNNDTFNYSTAYDMALLMSYAIKNETFYHISSKKYHNAVTKENDYHCKNKHKLITSTNYVKSGKTGYTKSSGRTLVSYAEINDMKLVAVSFNEGSDYNLDKILFDKVKDDFKKTLILERGVYPQEVSYLDYYPCLNEDIFLLIKNDSNVNIKFNLFEKPNDFCGYCEVYEDGILILKDTLYPYYPQT
jgi:D-alanyl-D-alanine carboxypeptidase